MFPFCSASSSPQPFDAPTDPAEARAERQARVLQRLCDICMDVAEALREQVLGQVAAEQAVDAGQTALALSRIARAVRLTLALESRLAEPGPEPRADDPGPAEGAPDVGARQRPNRRVQSALAVFKAIEVEVQGDAERRERLRSEVRERLMDLEHDIMSRPIGEVVAILCRELGLPHDPALWADEPWALAEAEDAAPPWPPPTDRGPPPHRAPEAALAADARPP